MIIKIKLTHFRRKFCGERTRSFFVSLYEAHNKERARGFSIDLEGLFIFLSSPLIFV